MAKKEDAAVKAAVVEKDDIEIEVIESDATTDTETEVEVKPEAATKQIVTPQEGVDDIKRQLADAEGKRRAAEAQAREVVKRATTVVGQSRAEQLIAYETTAKQVLDANKKALDAAKNAFKMAMESNDFAAAAETQAAIADAMQNIKGAQWQVAQLDGYRKQMESDAQQVTRRQEEATDQATDAGIDPSSRSGRWISQHAEQWRDPVFQRKALLADAQARKDNVEVESDEYFRRIEEATAAGKPEGVVAEKKEIGRPMAGATAAAPTRQAAGTEQRQTPAKVRLTAAQVEAASIAGITPTQYAKQLLVLEAEGRITRRQN